MRGKGIHVNEAPQRERQGGVNKFKVSVLMLKTVTFESHNSESA